MNMLRLTGKPFWIVSLCSGIIAGTVATLVQVLLWLAFTDQFPEILYRDARLTAALALGSEVLPPPATFDIAVWLAAMLIHFALSIIYAAVLLLLAARLARAAALLAGAVFGAVLYAVNLHGFAEVFPWFIQARGWITLVAHIAFGVAVIAVRQSPLIHARSPQGGH